MVFLQTCIWETAKNFVTSKEKKKSLDRDNADPFGSTRNGIMEVNKGQFHEIFGLKKTGESFHNRTANAWTP